MGLPWLYLDEDVEVGLARCLSAYDILTARDAGMRGHTDEEQLAFAAQGRRAILTHNIDDYIALHERYQLEGRGHWGIVTARRAPIGELEKRLGRLVASRDRGVTEVTPGACQLVVP